MRREVVTDGRLAGYFLATYSARKLGMKSTGNAGGAYNLELRSSRTQPGDDFEAMLSKLGTGVLVTELIGQGVNYVSGDYSAAQAASGWSAARFIIRSKNHHRREPARHVSQHRRRRCRSRFPRRQDRGQRDHRRHDDRRRLSKNPRGGQPAHDCAVFRSPVATSRPSGGGAMCDRTCRRSLGAARQDTGCRRA